ncbi:MAG TPA: Uma2 family endonuclease [Stellaceae bacterium]|nr:Uma2 family endonuclease [Stellaceae bacterium]
MSIAADRPMTLAEFLAWEHRQALRYEFDGFRPIVRTGGTIAHAAVQHNLHTAMGARLRGRPCQFFGSDVKVQTGERTSRYPDGIVICSGPPADATIVHDPVVIFEVLSDSTASDDYGVKNREYAAMPSVRRYVILHQDSIAGTMFERSGDDWIGHVLSAQSVLKMPEIDVEIAMAELYTGIELAPRQDTG